MQTFEPEPEIPFDDNCYSNRYFLCARQIALIDEALRSLGAFGEVRLVVEKGRPRFIVTQKSYEALRWYPGRIVLED